MPSILLTFENQEQHDEFLQIIAQLTECLDATADTKSQAELMTKVMSTATGVVPDSHQCKCDLNEKHALFISGKKMTEGSLPELQKLFKREVTQHSGSVEVRVYREGKWRPVMQRPGSPSTRH